MEQHAADYAPIPDVRACTWFSERGDPVDTMPYPVTRARWPSSGGTSAAQFVRLALRLEQHVSPVLEFGYAPK